jgi:acetolactate synthase-1/3 small subunit
MKNSDKNMHTLSVYVSNNPGVLARIAQVFARRGFNIESLVVSPAIDGQFSRMTISCSGNPEGLDQIIKQIMKLVDVLH